MRSDLQSVHDCTDNQTSAGSDVSDCVRKALDLIDQVHALPVDAPTVHIQTNTLGCSIGEYRDLDGYTFVVAEWPPG